jgi:hypothetical protein
VIPSNTPETSAFAERPRLHFSDTQPRHTDAIMLWCHYASE